MESVLTNPGSVAHIVLVYALVISIGLALGRIRVFGVSLGVTFVLFVGLLAGHFGIGVENHVLMFLRDFGLILFIFFIGLQVGPSFFSSFKSGGVVLNGLTVGAILLSIIVTLLLWAVAGGSIDLPAFLGVHYGAVTNTPGLGATQEALAVMGYQGEDIAVAYACAYPLGVVGIILSAIIIRVVFRINLADEDRAWEADEADKNEAPISFHVEVANGFLNGQTLEAIRRFIGRPFVCSRRKAVGEEISSPGPETQVRSGDILKIVAQADSKEAIVAFFGKEAGDVDLETPHSPVHSEMVVVTDPAVNGLRIKDLHVSHYDGLNITRIYRAGMEVFPYRSLHLQLGDRLRVVGPQRAITRFASRVGNQTQKLDHPNIISIFVGIALGILAGIIPIAIPGVPVPVKLGLAGGPLVVAILLGRYGPSLKLATYTTNSASLMLRELGMAFFLASVGLAAGGGFADAFIHGNGFLYMLYGVVITMVPLLIIGWAARRFFHFNYHSIVGLMAGATTDPPTLAYAATLSEKNSSAVAYSTVYPLAMFLRIVTGQILLIIFWSAV
ncbi:putative transporter [Sutterella sp.]|uniref:putative transporter n=1 Tax=Sutterella sp. TaxID=1981025 RepID=UPI0026DEC497|nr:putative transporter [Sutterella sp.]MDO5531884.1 putative transporter [Sutterella sp.]